MHTAASIHITAVSDSQRVLITVKALVEAQGGSISIESQVGVGSTVQIALRSCGQQS